jgi:hypothetical protein
LQGNSFCPVINTCMCNSKASGCPHIILQDGTDQRLYKRSALFWEIIQRWVVVLFRRFGTSYRSHLQGLRSPRCFPKRHRTTTQESILAQKSANLIYIAADASNYSKTI